MICFLNFSKSLKVVLLFFFLFFAKSVWAENLLIVEVQIAGEKFSDDFVKIYNPSNSDIYLGNYRGGYLKLVKRTSTSSKDYTIKSWARDLNAKIPARGFYLWANKNYTTLFEVNTSTSQTIAQNNGIALKLELKNNETIIDAVGWGNFDNVLFEGKAFPKNPIPNQKLKRKQIAGVYQDTNDNSQDFYLNLVSPPIKTKTSQKEKQSKLELESISEKKSKNMSSAPILETKEAKFSQGVKETFLKKEHPKRELVAIDKKIFKENFSFFPLIIAIPLAVFSGVIILILKNKLKNQSSKLSP